MGNGRNVTPSDTPPPKGPHLSIISKQVQQLGTKYSSMSLWGPFSFKLPHMKKSNYLIFNLYLISPTGAPNIKHLVKDCIFMNYMPRSLIEYVPPFIFLSSLILALWRIQVSCTLQISNKENLFPAKQKARANTRACLLHSTSMLCYPCISGLNIDSHRANGKDPSLFCCNKQESLRASCASLTVLHILSLFLLSLES